MILMKIRLFTRRNYGKYVLRCINTTAAYGGAGVCHYPLLLPSSNNTKTRSAFDDTSFGLSFYINPMLKKNPSIV